MAHISQQVNCLVTYRLLPFGFYPSVTHRLLLGSNTRDRVHIAQQLRVPASQRRGTSDAIQFQVDGLHVCNCDESTDAHGLPRLAKKIARHLRGLC